MSVVLSSATEGARGSSHPPDELAKASSHVRKKRPRPVLSCIECRKKKLKCDRLLPCNQCTRAEKIAQCVYQNRESSQSQHQHLVSDESEGELTPSRKKNNRMQSVLPTASRDSAPDQVPAPLLGYNEKPRVLENLQSRVETLERLLAVHPRLHTQADSQGYSRASQVCSRYFMFRFLFALNLLPIARNPAFKGCSPEDVFNDGTNDMKPFHNEHLESAKQYSANHQGILSLKGSRTRYFGPNHKLALLNRVS